MKTTTVSPLNPSTSVESDGKLGQAEYVSPEEFAAITAAMQARVQSVRLRRFAGKRERTFTVNLLVCSPLGGYTEERRKIRGFTLEDAKDQAGII